MLILTRVLIVILVKLLQLALRPVSLISTLLSVDGSVSSLRGRCPSHILLYNIWNGARRKRCWTEGVYTAPITLPPHHRDLIVLFTLAVPSEASSPDPLF